MSPLFLIPALFLVYSFIGWIIDTGSRSFFAGRFTRGVNFPLPQWVPLRPMYAFGAGLLLVLQPLYAHLSLLVQFLFMGCLLTVYEYVSAIVSEKVSGQKLWNYHDQRFNFQGRIALTNSIAWAVLGLLFVHVFHPWVLELMVGAEKM